MFLFMKRFSKHFSVEWYDFWACYLPALLNLPGGIEKNSNEGGGGMDPFLFPNPVDFAFWNVFFFVEA